MEIEMERKLSRSAVDLSMEVTVKMGGGRESQVASINLSPPAFPIQTSLPARSEGGESIKVVNVEEK